VVGKRGGQLALVGETPDDLLELTVGNGTAEAAELQRYDDRANL